MSQDKRNWHGNEPGILRKKDETDSELLVFGYSCKLFRDDEKALLIDQGKHLIPWMGDEQLKIDRYDVRGTLFDISKYEASNGETNIAWDELSNDERKMELKCDEERYRALLHNEDEEALYQEEELKRLHQALGNDKEYGQVAYQYEEKQSENVSNVMDEVVSDDQQEPFIPPVQLDIPPKMTIPETKKQNAIIEKTAMFINQQGPQMEILLKMKQASNPQFDFLSISCPLHSYYRHVLAVVKTGRYKPTFSNSDKPYRHNDYEDHYLHPSLLPTPSTLELAPLIPSISYRPSADCAYSMLVNRIKSKQEEITTVTTSVPTVSPVAEESKEIVGLPIIYTPITETVAVDPDKSASCVMRMVSKASKRKRRRREMETDSPSNGQQSPKTVIPILNEKDSSVGNLNQPESPIEEPPGEQKLIIDKMASYVVKNGKDFEAIVKNKGDPRFFFLNFDNKFHSYYKQKVLYYKALSKPDGTPFSKDLVSPVYSTENNESVSGEEEEKHILAPQITTNSSQSLTTKKCPSLVTNSTLSDQMLNKPNELLQLEETKLQHFSDSENQSTNKPTPVCFSIKKPKEVDKLELCSALPVEESSDEEEEKEENYNIKSQADVCKPSDEKKRKKGKKGKKPKVHTKSVDKWAEERVKDKLAQAAKEKLVMKDKEKQLQLKRRKRALAFLNLLQKDNLSPLRKPLVNDLGLREDSESRPTSVPTSITSFSSYGSADDEDDTHNCRQLIHDKAHQSTQTLDRMLGATPKKRNGHGKKSHHSKTSHSRSYSKSGSEKSSKHYHHKKHRSSKEKEKETHHRHSHKRKHKTKKSKSHKRRKKSESVNSLSSD